MKRAWPILLGLLLLAAPAAAQAQFGCVTNADNTLTITNYTGTNTVVAIPTNINNLLVTGIGAQAFYNSANLAGITIPTNVTSIGGFAFYACAGLSSIVIPGGVTNIGDSAFEFCTHLTNVVIPASLTSIGNVVFEFCASLTSITIPDSVTSIGDSAFYGCASLASVVIPDSVTNITAAAFHGCTGLTNVVIPDSLTSIGAEVFELCASLTSIVIPGSVTNIGYAAFYGCTSLTSITIPASVTDIGSNAFEDCSKLTGVYFTGNAPAADGTVFTNDNAKVYYLAGATGWDDFSADTGLETVLWNPLIQVAGANFGVQNNQFGFNITGTVNFTVVVEACTNLASPVWTPLQIATLTNGSFYFSDPQWSNYPARFYGLGFP